MESGQAPKSENSVTTEHSGKPRRTKSVYGALNALGHSVNNIYDKITRKSRSKRSSQSQSLSDLHLTSTQDQNSHKISSNSSLNSSTSDLREAPFVYKPAPTISDISEGTFSSEDGDDEMEVHWQDLSSLESHGQSGSGDDSTVPSIPKRKFSHNRKISSENKSIASSKWIESATADMESILINGHAAVAGIPEIIEDENEKKLKPTLKIRHDHAPRKNISFETRTDDKDVDSQSDTDSACDIPKHKSYRTARKNSMAPPKAFRRTKPVDPQ